MTHPALPPTLLANTTKHILYEKGQLMLQRPDRGVTVTWLPLRWFHPQSFGVSRPDLAGSALDSALAQG